MNINIIEEYLINLDINDSFFDSLKKDYNNFLEWFNRKALEGRKCFVTYYDNGKISSILILKEEYENENYNNFYKSFDNDKRLKICTFKVDNMGFGIGEYYLSIIYKKVLENKLSEIYVTVYPKYVNLIKFFIKYGFSLYTINDNKELVLVKDMRKYLKNNSKIKKI